MFGDLRPFWGTLPLLFTTIYIHLGWLLGGKGRKKIAQMVFATQIETYMLWALLKHSEIIFERLVDMTTLSTMTLKSQEAIQLENNYISEKKHARWVPLR